MDTKVVALAAALTVAILLLMLAAVLLIDVAARQFGPDVVMGFIFGSLGVAFIFGFSYIVVRARLRG